MIVFIQYCQSDHLIPSEKTEIYGVKNSNKHIILYLRASTTIRVHLFIFYIHAELKILFRRFKYTIPI